MTLNSLLRIRDAGNSCAPLRNREMEFFEGFSFSHAAAKMMLSIYSEFAEGFARDGNREFSQFASNPKASCTINRGRCRTSS